MKVKITVIRGKYFSPSSFKEGLTMGLPQNFLATFILFTLCKQVCVVFRCCVYFRYV